MYRALQRRQRDAGTAGRAAIPGDHGSILGNTARSMGILADQGIQQQQGIAGAIVIGTGITGDSQKLLGCAGLPNIGGALWETVRNSGYFGSF